MKNFVSCWWIIRIAVICCVSFAVQGEIVGPPDTNNLPSTPICTTLDSWSFRDTNNWTSDLGYYPTAFSNICLSSLGPGDSLQVDSQTTSMLAFNVWEANGTTNLNLEGGGGVMFWFAPNWASTSDTNDFGTGPGVYGRLLEVGTFTTNASYGWWSLYFDDAGNNTPLRSQQRRISKH